MRPSSSVSTIVVFVALGLGSVACVEKNPVVEVGREAGASIPAAPEVPGDLPPSDTADCSTCNEVLTSSLRNAVCRGNAKPSSAEVLGAYVDCVCKGECAETCALHCGGAPRDTVCASCAAEKCAEADKKCREDVKR